MSDDTRSSDTEEPEETVPRRDGRPGRRASSSEETPRPEARSVILSVVPDALGGGVKLSALEEEPQLPEIMQGSNKYAVHEVLGEGGMGRVYLAADADLRRTVALKMSRRADADTLARFVREAQIMGQLHHPGIVPVHELGLTEQGRPYYTMPLVRGRSLQSVLERLRRGESDSHGEWSLTRLVQVFIQVCQAVGYAHAKGVLHRDLKPANVMVGRHGEVQVLDWGLAKLIAGPAKEVSLASEAQTEDGLVIGSPAYMSPEQATGGSLDHRSDVHALGVMLYELLTLRLPFEGETSAQILSRIADEKPPPARQVARDRDVPQALEAACLRALAKRPDERQASVEELAAEVQDWLENATDRARRRELADQKAAAGKSLLAEHERLQAELVELEQAVRAAGRGVRHWQPVEEKEELLAARSALERARDESVESASAAVATLTEAIGHDADHAEARGALADYYWGRLLEAEEQGQHRDVRFFGKLVAAYHDGRYARELDGGGTLALDSTPAGAEVWLHELVEDRLVLRPGPARLLGRTPLPETPLPMGSYLVVLKAPGRRDTHHPVSISRNRDWRETVRLHRDEEIGAGFLHVPAGPFVQGGDPSCRGWVLPRAEVRVDDFFIAEHPVTNAEYLEYLNDIAAAEGIDAALARSPRRVPDESASSYLEARGRELVLSERDSEGDAWMPGQPVVGISWHDAADYCAWRSERDGRELRLPTEGEWEKAARGVDGRWFPWGWHFDASFCNMNASRREGEDVIFEVTELASRFPADVSIYGVRGLAGNVRDWTSTEAGVSRGVRVLKGGAWNDGSVLSRCAARDLGEATNVQGHFGLRLAATPPAG